MRRGRMPAGAFALVAFLIIWLTTPAGAVELTVNGGFESGLAGWTVFNQPGGSGDFFLQSGMGSPMNGFAVPAPPEGTNAAMSDQTGPGSHILYQDVALPAGSTNTLQFKVFISNQAGVFATPPSLDFNVTPNQQARVDIMNPGAAVQDVGAGVLLNVFQTMVGDPPVSGYALITADISAFAGQTIRLRFSEVDNQFFFNMGVDAVSIDSQSRAVPGPGGLLLLGSGLLGVAAAVGRRAR